MSISIIVGAGIGVAAYWTNDAVCMTDELFYKIFVFYDDLEDYILPKVKPLFSQVESRRPINNPIAGRCY